MDLLSWQLLAVWERTVVFVSGAVTDKLACSGEKPPTLQRQETQGQQPKRRQDGERVTGWEGSSRSGKRKRENEGVMEKIEFSIQMYELVDYKAF